MGLVGIESPPQKSDLGGRNSASLKELETGQSVEAEYYENGQLDWKATSVAGVWDGPYESYYENGQLEFKATYVAGERDGPYEEYYENGQLEEKGTYNMGEKCGEWIEDGETVAYPPC